MPEHFSEADKMASDSESELEFDENTAKTVAELLQLPKVEAHPPCTQLSEGIDAIVATDLRVLELQEQDAPESLPATISIDCPSDDQDDRQVDEPRPAVLVSETDRKSTRLNSSH